eukprot:4129476-Alexandrium_andersonii.AAC.1
MIRRPPRSTHCISSISSAASDVYKRQILPETPRSTFGHLRAPSGMFGELQALSLIHISEPTRLALI